MFFGLVSGLPVARTHKAEWCQRIRDGRSLPHGKALQLSNLLAVAGLDKIPA